MRDQRCPDVTQGLREEAKRIPRPLGGPQGDNAQGSSSATLTECAGPEFQAPEGQEGLGAVAVQEALERPVSMVTPEALSNPELAMAKPAGSKRVPSISQG